MTSVAGPNHGSELADHIHRHYPIDGVKGRIMSALFHLVAWVMGVLETGYRGPRFKADLQASHHSLTSEGVALFNRQYPQGLPAMWGGQGLEEVNGVRYYSWSGTLQPGITDRGRNLFDGTHRSCRLFARSFVREKGQCDGMVGATVHTWEGSSVTITRWTILISSTSPWGWWARARSRSACSWNMHRG